MKTWKNESKYWNKSGIDTPSFGSCWKKPTIKESYQDIKKRFLFEKYSETIDYVLNKQYINL